MAYTRTLLQLRTSLLKRGGYERSSDITPTVANELLNDALEETYNLIVERWDDYYTKLGTAFVTVAGTDTYSVPDDFYKLRKVEKLISGVATDPDARWERIYPIDVDDAHRPRQNRHGKYRITQDGVVIVPSPPSGQTFRIYYLPLAPQLSADTDTIQFDTPVEQKLVLNIALRDCYDRQDLPTNEIEAKIAKLAAGLRTAADHDAGEPFYLGRRTDDEDEYGRF